MNDGWASYLLDEVHVAAELARLERTVRLEEDLRLEHLHERLDQLVGAVGEHGDLAYQILEEKEWRER